MGSSAAGNLVLTLTTAEGVTQDVTIAVANSDTAAAVAGKLKTALEAVNANITGMAGTTTGSSVAIASTIYKDSKTVTFSGASNTAATFSLSSVSNTVPFHAVDNSVTTSTTGSIVVGRTEPRYMMHSYFGEKREINHGVGRSKNIYGQIHSITAFSYVPLSKLLRRNIFHSL